MSKVLPLIFLGVGVFILIQVILPSLAFQLWQLSYHQDNLVDPTLASANSDVLGVSVQNVNNFPAFVSSGNFSAPYSEFELSAPSIKLEKTKVLVNSNNFEKSLAQLPGSALPGERGNVFITGHSSIPQFFRPDNFQAIFSHLPELKKGDLIYLDVLGSRYQYSVESMKVVDPSDVSVINPPDDQGRYLSLMTCVPPGFNTKRLIVLAKLK